MSNYKVLFILRVLKNILVSFVDSFFILYFLDVSNSNILPLGLYKLVATVCIFLVIFFVRRITKSQKRTVLLRIGIVLDFIYFLTIILLKEKIVDYVVLIGILYGLEEGFYYSVYNVIESYGISNEERAKFTGTYTAVQSIMAIVFPLIFGGFIKSQGFIKCLFIVLAIIILRIIFSFIFKDDYKPESNKTDLKAFYQLVKDNKQIKACKLEMFSEGLTVSEGAFSYIVTIYIAKVFSDSFSLGIFTSVFSIISTIIGFYFARWLKRKHYLNVIRVSMVLAIVSLIFMIVNTNAVSIILFKLFYTVVIGFVGLINGTSFANISNIPLIAKEYKIEYYLLSEKCLVIGRVISNLLFILMAYTSEYMIIVFVILLMLYGFASINLEKSFTNEDRN